MNNIKIYNEYIYIQETILVQSDNNSMVKVKLGLNCILVQKHKNKSNLSYINWCQILNWNQ